MATKKTNTNPTRKAKVKAKKDIKGKVAVSLPATEEHEATTKTINVAGIHGHDNKDLLDSLNVSEGHLRYKKSSTETNEALANKADVDNEKSRAQGAETTLQTNITNEASARQSGDSSLSTSISNEADARESADNTLQGNIDNVTDLIPSQASTTNQLADKAFVNSTVDSATASYIFNPNTDDVWESLQDLKDYTTKQTVKKNDYAVIRTPVTANDDPQKYNYVRYKFTPPTEQGTPYANGWGAEYPLHFGFTAAQWAALNSGATAAAIAKAHEHSNKSTLDTITGSETLIFSINGVDVTKHFATTSA